MRPLPGASMGKFFAKAFVEPVLQKSSWSARVCERYQTRPFPSITGWLGLTGSFHASSLPQYGDGAIMVCDDHVRIFARSSSFVIGARTLDLVNFTGSTTSNAPADQSAP